MRDGLRFPALIFSILFLKHYNDDIWPHKPMRVCDLMLLFFELTVTALIGYWWVG